MQNNNSQPKGYFDAEAFFDALATHKGDKTWKKVAEEAGVSASTLTRMAQQKRPDVDSLAKLASWSGVKVDDYIVRSKGAPKETDTLTQVLTNLRADKNLSGPNATALEEIVKAAYNSLKGK